MGLTFLDFKTAVGDLITVDHARFGTESYIPRLIRLGLIDLQRYVEQLQSGQKNVFTVFDVVQEGEANVGTLPEGAMVRDLYYVTKDCPCSQRPFVPYPWDNRFDLICGSPKISNWQYFVCIDPHAQEFTIFPALKETAELWLYWDGLKSDYADGDTTRFTEAEAEAVSQYVKYHLLLEVDKDPVLAGVYKSLYEGGPGQSGTRTKLYLDWKRRGQVKTPHDSPQPYSQCKSITCCFSVEGAGCGFSNGYFYLYDSVTALWHPITMIGGVGSEQIKIGAGVASVTFDTCIVGAGTGYMFSGGYMHLLNEDTGKFISIVVASEGGVDMLRLDIQKGSAGMISPTAAGYRFDPCPSIRNVGTQLWHTLSLFDDGGGVPQVQIGAGAA